MVNFLNNKKGKSIPYSAVKGIKHWIPFTMKKNGRHLQKNERFANQTAGENKRNAIVLEEAAEKLSLWAYLLLFIINRHLKVIEI